MWLSEGAIWRRERGLTECRAPLRSRVGNPTKGLFFELPGTAACSSGGFGTAEAEPRLCRGSSRRR